MTAKRLAAAACQHDRGHRSEAWLCPQVGNGRLEFAGGGSGDRLRGPEVAAGPRQSSEMSELVSWRALATPHTSCLLPETGASASVVRTGQSRLCRGVCRERRMEVLMCR